MNVLAIDQGTSATKAIVVDAEGEVRGEASAPVAPRPGPGGAVEQDPEELLDSILSAGRAAIAAAAVEVEAVGLGNQGETVVRWDRASGTAFGPAISWQDRRAEAIVASLRPQAERLAAISGLPLDPYFAAPKMRWLADRDGGEGDAISTIDAWVNQRLCGAYVSDASTASRTMLLDLDGGDWSAEACSVFGIDPATLPEVVACDARVGVTDAFGPALPVCALVVDQQAALFGEGCLAAGEAKCTYGTGAFLLANTGTAAVRSRAGLAASIAWRIGDRLSYCLDGQVYAAGAAVSWLERLGLIGSAAELDACCASGRPPADVVFVPALAGLAAPVWSSAARAAWTGLSLASGAADLVAAVVWGIAAEVARLAAAVAEDLGEPLRSLRVDGGLTRSAALMQAQADLLQAPVECFPSTDATALGIAALARLGASPGVDPARAISAPAPARIYEPAIPASEAEAWLARFAGSVEAAAKLGGGGR